MALVDRFWRRVDKNGPIHPILGTRCWLWTGNRDKNGYGRIGVEVGEPGKNKPTMLVHRVSYEINVGPIPDGHGVLHHCDNPPCVRPDHLFTGTQTANMRDCSRKDRTIFGNRAPWAKLTASDVEQMHALYRAGGVSHSDLARRFGVRTGTVGQILRGENWRREHERQSA